MHLSLFHHFVCTIIFFRAIPSGLAAVTNKNGCHLQNFSQNISFDFNHNNWNTAETVITERLYDDHIDQGRIGVATFRCSIETSLVVTLTKDYDKLVSLGPGVFLDHYDFLDSVGGDMERVPYPVNDAACTEDIEDCANGNNGLVHAGDSSHPRSQLQYMAITVGNNDIAGYALRECRKLFDSDGK